MLYVVWLLWDNRAFAAGYAANSLVFKAGPYVILAVFVIGIGLRAVAAVGQAGDLRRDRAHRHGGRARARGDIVPRVEANSPRHAACSGPFACCRRLELAVG